MKPGTRVRLAAADTKTSQTKVVIKTPVMEVVQLLIPAGQKIPTYEVQGEIIIHCLEGSVSLSALRKVYDLSAGDLLYLLTNEPFSLQAQQDASVLVTMIAQVGAPAEMIGARLSVPGISS
jgi:quercetin dioxygenase-like cupin family protein